MTLEQKVGQITQADIRSVTPDDVRRYYLGSILNGGGAWPGMNMHASVGDWLKLSDDYLPRVDVDRHGGQGAGDLGHRRRPRPQQRLWRDALPAQHRARRGARSGADGADRPGDGGAGSRDRHHLGVRADAGRRAEPALGPDLRKLQLRPGRGPRLCARRWSAGSRASSARSTSVLATAKHWLGDGGTFHGQNQGETRTSEADLYRTHAAGYYGALARQRADGDGQLFELHRHRDRPAPGARCTATPISIGDVLKGRLGFDGLVVSDWNGIEPGPGLHQLALPAGDQRRDRSRHGPRRLEEVHRRDDRGRSGGPHPDEPDRRCGDADHRVKLRSGLFDASPATGPHPGAEVMSFAGGARARARGGAQVARAAEERRRRASA